MDQKLSTQLSTLVERLKGALGDHLVSAILYGSAAAGDWNENSSDLNVLCVLDQVTPAELAASEPVVRWWRDGQNPPPLMLSTEEVRNSTDCFPMEFHDMKEHRRVLFGADVIQNLEVDRVFYRAQVEHELRAKQIRLRQRAAEMLSAPDRLLKLLTDSVSTFCVLGRHALILGGHTPRWTKTEIVAGLEHALGTSMTGTSEILAVRAAGKQAPKLDPVPLFARYLAEMDSIVRFVDALDR